MKKDGAPQRLKRLIGHDLQLAMTVYNTVHHRLAQRSPVQGRTHPSQTFPLLPTPSGQPTAQLKARLGSARIRLPL